MKRDMDLIRELMLKLEALPLRPGDVWLLASHTEDIQIDGFDLNLVLPEHRKHTNDQW